jgi:hypothetical protein
MFYDPVTPARADQTAQLEQAFITDYLARQGHSRASLAELPSEASNALRRAASFYASSKLAEMEARAHYVHEIHDVTRRE